MQVALHATHDRIVILEGESGTGKKHLASLIHRCSPRREGPFVSITLGSATDETARAILFPRRQALLSETRDESKGFLELVRRGTVYIEGLSYNAPLMDEITRLIRRRLFDDVARLDSVRILLGVTTQRESYQPRTAPSLQSDGLDCERMHIPPLRERRDDIEALVACFIRQRCQQTGKELRFISAAAMKALRGYDWPQNVRELSALANQLVKHSTPPSIDVSQLPTYMSDSREPKGPIPSSGLDLDDEVRRYEIDLICAALRQSRGQQNKAADLLRMKPTTLFMKIRRHGIDVRDFR
jgi:DNA-binding NtrC family response regulator